MVLPRPSVERASLPPPPVRMVREYKGPRTAVAEALLLPGKVVAGDGSSVGTAVLAGPGHERRRARRMLRLAIALWAIALVAIASWVFGG